MLTRVDIIELIAGMFLEDSQQPRLSPEEFPSLLGEELGMHELNSQRSNLSAINTQLEEHQAETDASASSAAHFVNRPSLLSSWPGDAWPEWLDYRLAMICPDCSELLPHDLAHVQRHKAECSGSVEQFLGRYMHLCESIERMIKAGDDMFLLPACEHCPCDHG